MGYSIATPMKSQKAMARMFAFMGRHYRGLSDITDAFADPNSGFFIDPGGDATRFLTDDLDYDPGSARIGYNYGCLMGAARYYCFSILSWMALHGGKVRRFNELSKGYSAPYYVADGCDSYPVLIADLWRERLTPEDITLYAMGPGVGDPIRCDVLQLGVYKIERNDQQIIVATVDSTGYRPSPVHWTKHPEQAAEKALIEPVVKAELARLTELWNEARP